MKKIFRNKPLVAGSVLVLLVIAVSIFAPFLSFHDPYEMNFEKRLELPSKSHWLGTDNFGRDLWSRIAYGTRVSALIAILSVFLLLTFGAIFESVNKNYMEFEAPVPEDMKHALEVLEQLDLQL